ncbi:Gfo/Idh/MocA family oxidoreductase [Paenibacillus sp. HN-1]|uniref:Gfo/Idh/MocA family protein n=1 Tax=Paenibacillus TaxID=44249 RepID=UPI001CA88A03|nr:MULTISPECIES: Gfo/Idh/MocA family oxidoreductase [Paenibacillus]MBY9079767.1 Gfo/Idh/MocA family oxidoreductase [Paenibacillus sp. CGMCC 1.18879]MBY9084411.1 Gfo/Idh/MocA family oxidoreductase [Paenibacillus sinensis]
MRKAKIGIIGVGNISGIYLENLTKNFLNTEVYACADRDEDKARGAAETYGIPHVLTTEELLADPNIEIVLNLTTPAGHFEICREALLSGKHVYVEKPLSLSLEHGTELVALAREKNLMIGCAPDAFLGAGLQLCRKLIDDGFIGDPVAATAFMVCHGHESWHPNPEFYYQKGGGPMFDMGPYYLTALVSLLGPAETVCGMTKTSFPQRTITSAPKYGSIIDVEVPTHVAGTVQFAGGAVASIITSFDVWSSQLPRIEIYGSRGTLLVPDPNTFGGPVLLRPAGASEFMEIPLIHSYDENSRGIGVADMARCIETGGTPRANGELANHVLEIMHAFHVSSDSGQYISLTTGCERPAPLAPGLLRGEVK